MKTATSLLLTLAAAVTLTGTALAGPWYAKGDFYCPPGCWNFDGGNELFDDGLHGDGAAGDGVFGASVLSDAVGPIKKEFKIALDDWSTSYPGSNAWVYIDAAPTTVHFTLDTNAHGDGWLPDQNIVWLDHAFPAGTTFEVIGSAAETGSWTSGVAATLVGDIWNLVVTIAAPGNYEAKFRATGTWDVLNMGANGLDPGGANLTYTTAVPNTDVQFEFDQSTGRVRVSVLGATPTAQRSWGRVKVMYR